ncbi:Amino acid/polyamine transporter I [Penicillium vulpinum]|uniref:Uncharacterized protein n=1 Tax=Penicillium vulpinum TaxID=29845 RepID=A0A1V6REJ0_9EURO|nr:Amino acid/polyamine transporter I [Penicillium vulpinum]KAJ5971220.1 Amino acid/polyamine transporter I [Penicillium vulpinum]OQE00212.1 hypothetical protein PENVUL_c056G02828 [Penicillium vulpinum]
MEEFAAFLESIRPRLELADAIYLMIFDLLAPKEEDIQSKEFIKLARIIICEQPEVSISWYVATKLMLHKLEKEILHLSYCINCQIGSVNMAYNEFDDIFESIIQIFLLNDLKLERGIEAYGAVMPSSLAISAMEVAPDRAQADDLPSSKQITITNVKVFSNTSRLKCWKTDIRLV